MDRITEASYYEQKRSEIKTIFSYSIWELAEVLRQHKTIRYGNGKIIVASIVSASSTVCRCAKKNLTLDDLIKFQAHFYYDKKRKWLLQIKHELRLVVKEFEFQSMAEA